MALSHEERIKIEAQLSTLNQLIALHQQKENYYGCENPDAEEEEYFTRLLRQDYKERYELEQQLKNG